MTTVVVGFQDILLYNKCPDFYSLIYPLVVAVVLLLLALVIYKRGSEDMADAL